jgi:uncharacterized protein YndB with AHSA1/START domain
MKKKH